VLTFIRQLHSSSEPWEDRALRLRDFVEQTADWQGLDRLRDLGGKQQRRPSLSTPTPDIDTTDSDDLTEALHQLTVDDQGEVSALIRRDEPWQT
jgi:hypothetical protein